MANKTHVLLVYGRVADLHQPGTSRGCFEHSDIYPHVVWGHTDRQPTEHPSIPFTQGLYDPKYPV